MNQVFADTSYFLALLAPNDAYREAARKWTQTTASQVVTTEYELLEVGNHLSRSSLRSICAEFLESIRYRSEVKVVPASPDLFDRAVKLFCSRPDKSWSLTDCTSFIFMRESNVFDALTFDKHFEQAGFTSLLDRPK